MKQLPVIPVFLLAAAAAVPTVGAAQQQLPTPVTVANSSAAAEPPPVKVATIFGQNALASTLEGQKATRALTTRFAPQREAFEKKQAELQSLRDQLKKGQATMSPAAIAQLKRDIESKNKEAQRLGEDSQAALEKEESDLMQQLGDKLMAVIQRYAASHGLAFVVDVSVPDGPIVWASPAIDITNEIVKLYDQAHPVASSPAPPPPAPPAKK